MLKFQHKKLKLRITKEFKFQCSLLDSNNIETICQPIPTIEQYIPCITFQNDIILFCKNHPNAIHFLKEWFQNPNEFRMYNFTYQGEEFSVIAEVLFALLVEEFKGKIQNNCFIYSTIVDVPKEYKSLLNRIYVSLDAIGIVGLKYEKNGYEYKEQIELLKELMKRKEDHRKEAEKNENTEMSTEATIEHLLQLNKYCCFKNNEENQSRLKFKFLDEDNVKKRKRKIRITTKCAFYASQYFEHLNDFKNLEMVSKKFRGNMERFHFNPISLGEKTVHFFPNITTFHLYFPYDKYLINDHFKKYVNWNPIGVEMLKKQPENLEIEFKQKVYNREDRKFDYMEGRTSRVRSSSYKHNFVIPEGVVKIEENCFDNYHKINSLKIPSSITNIDDINLQTCSLRSIEIPLTNEHLIIGNKIFIKKSHFDQSIKLPSTINTINGIKVTPSYKFEIPSFVTSLSPNVFADCGSITSLTIPKTCRKYSYNLLKPLTQLRNLYISSSWIFQGDRLCRGRHGIYQSLHLPSSIEIINDFSVKYQQLQSVTIPSTVTKISDYCFDECYQLSEIIGLENVVTLGRNSFRNCNQLNYDDYPLIKNQFKKCVEGFSESDWAWLVWWNHEEDSEINCFVK